MKLAIPLLIFILVAAVLVYYFIRRSPARSTGPLGFANTSPTDNTDGPNKPFCSLVLFLKSPRTLDIKSLTAAAQTAFNHPFNADDTFCAVAMPRPGYFAVKTPDAFLGIINVSQPYSNNVAAVASAIDDPDIRNALLTHTAWLSVDWVGELPPGGHPRAYQHISKMTAELLGDDVLAIFCTTTRHGHVSTPGDRDALRNGLILDLFNGLPKEIVVKTAEDDPELAAAAAEARRRWPECVTAFNTPGTADTFAVKKAFTDDTAVEHMWVVITTIEGNTIRGHLNSNPNTLHNVKDGDPVTLTADEIEDWLYTKGKNMIGGFQLKVLSQRQ